MIGDMLFFEEALSFLLLFFDSPSYKRLVFPSVRLSA